MLPGIRNDVEDLWPRRADQLAVVGTDRPQRRPAVVEQRIEGFGIDASIQFDILSRDQWQQALSVNRLRRGEADRIENRREDVDVADGRIHHAAGNRTDRRTHDQRYVDCRVVDEEPVRRLSVITQPFSVIGSENDQRLIQEAALFE